MRREPVNAFVNRAIRAAVPFIVFPFRNLVKCSFAVEPFHAWVSFVWNNFQHFIRAIRDAVNIPVRSGDAAVKFVVLRARHLRNNILANHTNRLCFLRRVFPVSRLFHVHPQYGFRVTRNRVQVSIFCLCNLPAVPHPLLLPFRPIVRVA